MAENTAKKTETKTTKSERVKVTIPRIPGQKEQPDVIVGVSGKNYQIQRGKEVEVPVAVAEILKFQEKAEKEYEEYLFGYSTD